MDDRAAETEWLELSGLPRELNDNVKPAAWSVFRVIVDLDFRRNRRPGPVEASLDEVGARSGLAWERAAKVLEALSRKRYLAAFIPDNPEELGLYQIRTPIRTPISADRVAVLSADPRLRDASVFRYLDAPDHDAESEVKVQKVLDLYLNTLSQKLNSFIVEEAEMMARRFEYEDIRRIMERAARNEIRALGWVMKELIREGRKKREAEEPEGTEA